MTIGAIDPLKVASGTADCEAMVSVFRASLTTGDELFERLRTIRDDDLMRGFCRRLQKYVEHGR